MIPGTANQEVLPLNTIFVIISFVLMILFPLLLLFLISFNIYRKKSGKGLPDNSYRPFDYITGQSSTLFQEEHTSENRKKD